MKASPIWMIQVQEHEEPWCVWDGPWDTRYRARAVMADEREDDRSENITHRRFRVVKYIPASEEL